MAPLVAPLSAPTSVCQREQARRSRPRNVLGKPWRCAEARGSTTRRFSPRPGSRAGSQARGERPPRLRGALTPRLAARVGPLGSLPPRPSRRTGSRDGTARDPVATTIGAALLTKGARILLIKPRTNLVKIVRHICRLEEPNRDALVLDARFIGDTPDDIFNQLIEAAYE